MRLLNWEDLPVSSRRLLQKMAIDETLRQLRTGFSIVLALALGFCGTLYVLGVYSATYTPASDVIEPVFLSGTITSVLSLVGGWIIHRVLISQAIKKQKFSVKLNWYKGAMAIRGYSTLGPATMYFVLYTISDNRNALLLAICLFVLTIFAFPTERRLMKALQIQHIPNNINERSDIG